MLRREQPAVSVDVCVRLSGDKCFLFVCAGSSNPRLGLPVVVDDELSGGECSPSICCLDDLVSRRKQPVVPVVVCVWLS